MASTWSHRPRVTRGPKNSAQAVLTKVWEGGSETAKAVGANAASDPKWPRGSMGLAVSTCGVRSLPVPGPPDTLPYTSQAAVSLSYCQLRHVDYAPTILSDSAPLDSLIGPPSLPRNSPSKGTQLLTLGGICNESSGALHARPQNSAPNCSDKRCGRAGQKQ